MNENTPNQQDEQDEQSCTIDGLSDHLHIGTAAIEAGSVELAELAELEAMVAEPQVAADEDAPAREARSSPRIIDLARLIWFQPANGREREPRARPSAYITPLVIRKAR